MYKTLLAAKDPKLSDEIKNLDVWKNKTGFEIAAVSENDEDALKMAANQKFDLIISEIWEDANDFIVKLKKSYFQNIIMISRDLTLENARFCIINGVNDYFVLPFDKIKFTEAFERIKLEKLSYREKIHIYSEKLTNIFNERSTRFLERLKQISEELYAFLNDADIADKAVTELTELVVTANHRVRDLGYKPYLAPAMSSAAISILLTIRGEWHYSSIWFGDRENGAFLGLYNRFTKTGPEWEDEPLPEALFERIRQSYQELKELA